jgi:hypothetical protein
MEMSSWWPTSREGATLGRRLAVAEQGSSSRRGRALLLKQACGDGGWVPKSRTWNVRRRRERIVWWLDRTW